MRELAVFALVLVVLAFFAVFSQAEQPAQSFNVTASANKRIVEAGEDIAFSAGISYPIETPAGSVPYEYDYNWRFGDGFSSTEQNPVHAYSSAGDYTARVTATQFSAQGANNSSHSSIAVKVYLLNVFGNADDLTPAVGQEVEFSSSSLVQGVEDAEFEWFFGDGQSEHGESVSHSYSSTGSKQVKLRVSGTVELDAPNGQADENKFVSEDYNFYLEVSGDSNNHPPDGNQSGNSGSNGGQQPPANEAPRAVISPRVGEVGIGSVVKFSSLDSTDEDGSIAGVSWRFTDDDSASSESVVEHVFRKLGEFLVRLTVRDERGVLGSDEVKVKVTATAAVVKLPPVPVLSLKSSYYVGEEILVSFKDSHDPDGGSVSAVVEYYDDLGRKVSRNGDFGAKFFLPGRKTFSLTVTDDEGVSVSKTVEVEVQALLASVNPAELKEAYERAVEAVAGFERGEGGKLEAVLLTGAAEAAVGSPAVTLELVSACLVEASASSADCSTGVEVECACSGDECRCPTGFERLEELYSKAFVSVSESEGRVVKTVKSIASLDSGALVPAAAAVEKTVAVEGGRQSVEVRVANVSATERVLEVVESLPKSLLRNGVVLEGDCRLDNGDCEARLKGVFGNSLDVGSFILEDNDPVYSVSFKAAAGEVKTLSYDVADAGTSEAGVPRVTLAGCDDYRVEVASPLAGQVFDSGATSGVLQFKLFKGASAVFSPNVSAKLQGPDGAEQLLSLNYNPSESSYFASFLLNSPISRDSQAYSLIVKVPHAVCSISDAVVEFEKAGAGASSGRFGADYLQSLALPAGLALTLAGAAAWLLFFRKK